MGGRGQREYHSLVIFVQTQLSPSPFFSSPPQGPLFSLSSPSGFSPRLCFFFCFSISVSPCLCVSLSLFLCGHLYPPPEGGSLGGREKSRGKRTEGHGFWQPTEMNPLSFPPPQYSFQDEQDKPLPVPSNQCCKYFSAPSWAPDETLILPLTP